MEIRFQTQGPEKWSGQCLLAPAFEDENLPEINPELDQACPWLTVAPALKDFHGKAGELVMLHGHPELAVPRVMAIGLGKRDEFSLNVLRTSLAHATRHARKCALGSLLLPEPILDRFPGGKERLLQESVYACLVALYRFTDLKTDKASLEPDPAWLAIGLNAPNDPAETAARRGERDALAVMHARDLDNLPGNLLYPESLALKASALAHERGLKCTVLTEEGLREAGLGCLLAVGQGSAHPPRLIILEHAPLGHEQDKPMILIGKGVTFDSGGLCLKPSEGMWQMKCDMSGAGAVMSALGAFAEEQTPRRIIGILACAENMPDGGAYRPGDVVTAANGESVEVINTDAEGRLALCDAIAYAQQQWTPLLLLDIATLTGACAVALGPELAGLFCEDKALVAQIMARGPITGENYWPLPLWAPYAEQLKSEIADIRHTAKREGGAITAALFLKHFVRKGELWAHLDIASVDWSDGKSPLCPAGASGFGVRTLLELGRGGLE